jgi:hypothetical protein
MADQVVDTIDLETVAKEAVEIKKEATPVVKCLSLKLQNWLKNR